MISLLKRLFITDPKKKIEKEIARLYEKSVYLQRNGDLRTYGEVMSKIEALEKELTKLLENEE
jgi:hypothetical protein